MRFPKIQKLLKSDINTLNCELVKIIEHRPYAVVFCSHLPLYVRHPTCPQVFRSSNARTSSRRGASSHFLPSKIGDSNTHTNALVILPFSHPSALLSIDGGSHFLYTMFPDREEEKNRLNIKSLLLFVGRRTRARAPIDSSPYTFSASQLFVLLVSLTSRVL